MYQSDENKPLDGSINRYKQIEKKWKKPIKEVEKIVSTDEDLFDFQKLSVSQKKQVKTIGMFSFGDTEHPVYSFESTSNEQNQGFYIIPNAIDKQTQLEIAYKCLTEYVEAPHVTNMHQQNEQVAQIWYKARQEKPHDFTKAPAFNKLHWAALGYHYDWTARQYHDANFSPVPAFLDEFGAKCAQACRMTLKSEAVIVNFYKKSSTMGGHQDDVEYTMDYPVVSLSLGADAIFLKGSTTKEDKPLQVLLRSGDIAIMGGNSRLSFHGIAKIIPRPFEVTEEIYDNLVSDENEEEKDSSKRRKEYQDIVKYLGTHRVNINLRQVYTSAKRAKTKES